jgi:N4-gp56 family major capsid protein
MATTTTTSLSTQYQRYFSKKLLDVAKQALVLNQFAVKADLPKNAGVKTARFFRRVQAAAANVQTLTEGTAINTFTEVTMENVDVDLVQLGEAVKLTDIVGMTALFDALKQGIDLMGEDCALKADSATRDAIIAGSTLERYGQGLASFAALGSAAASAATVKASDLLDCMTNLEIKRAPRINGSYVAIAPPQVARDIMRDTDWLTASEYSAVQQLFKGEIGSLYGVRVIMATNPFIEGTTKGTYSGAGDKFTTIVTGQGGYGVTSLSGESPSASPRIIIADKADKSDPLNQFMTAGWKAMYAATVLNPNWVVALRSKTLYS